MDISLYSVCKAGRQSVHIHIMNSSTSPPRAVLRTDGCHVLHTSRVSQWCHPSASGISCSVCKWNRKVSQVNSELQAAVNPKLSRRNKEKLLLTLLDFSDICQDQLGHTTVLEHHINTGNSPPLCQFPC